MFLDHIHPPGSTYFRLSETYTNRWCKIVLTEGSVPYLTYTACENLKWLSHHVPARVHLANARLHFNGWHTECRYQRRGAPCRFCLEQGSEDRIEHFLECEWVSSCFPLLWKQGEPPKVPPSKFFLLGLGEDDKVVLAISNWSLYTVCNSIRHCNIRSELRRALMRTMGEIYMRPSVKKAREDIFGFPRPPEST